MMSMGLRLAARSSAKKRLNLALDVLDGLLTVHDGMVICGIGKTEKEPTSDHNAKVKQFLQQWKERGVKLIRKKLKLLCKEIPYVGHLVTVDGLKFVMLFSPL